MQRKEYNIDAKNQVLGRLATRVAILLRGKNKSDFAPNKDIGDFVTIKNAAKMKISGKKMEQKTYFSHSGFLGGERNIPMAKIFSNNPGEILKKAVFGMLPKNKLRSRQIKRLKVIG